MPTAASGGGYSGPLAYRQGKGMRPDVAVAFDRMAAAARRAGISLVITSAYRSDAEQARLFEQHPDPRWVAPPGQSLHRCATELDLGPSSAYAMARRQRAPVRLRQALLLGAVALRLRARPGALLARLATRLGGRSRGRRDGEPAPGSRLRPGAVPGADQRAAARWNVSAGLLAAQLMAESNFNPFAVSPAGAQGIAQFMPGTARAYGLEDPFDAPAAIDAQAHLMSDLLAPVRGSVAAGPRRLQRRPGAGGRLRLRPADIPRPRPTSPASSGCMGGAGELVAPALEVRLVS